MSGRLSIVATPIGNLEDVTLRALRVLRECERILAEDTRRTRVLLAHHGIATPLAAFHAHTPADRVSAVAAELAAGAHYALVTDAGTPLVSDPGAELVRAAVAAGVTVEPIPGASAVLAALALAAPHGPAFRFAGFLPRSGGKRRRAIEALARDADAGVIFEAPSRVGATLSELAKIAPDRRAVVCRELTKLHEEAARGTLSELAARFAEGARGEITIVLDALEPEEPEPDDEAALARARELLASGASARDAARTLAEEHGLPKSRAYELVLSLVSRD